jgi:hypothetical protein
MSCHQSTADKVQKPPQSPANRHNHHHDQTSAGDRETLARSTPASTATTLHRAATSTSHRRCRRRPRFEVGADLPPWEELARLPLQHCGDHRTTAPRTSLGLTTMSAQSMPLSLLSGPPCRGGGLRPTAQASVVDARQTMPLHQGTHWICPENDHADPSPAPHGYGSTPDGGRDAATRREEPRTLGHVARHPPRRNEDSGQGAHCHAQHQDPLCY